MLPRKRASRALIGFIRIYSTDMQTIILTYKPMRAESKRIVLVDRHLAVTVLCIDNLPVTNAWRAPCHLTSSVIHWCRKNGKFPNITKPSLYFIWQLKVTRVCPIDTCLGAWLSHTNSTPLLQHFADVLLPPSPTWKEIMSHMHCIPSQNTQILFSSRFYSS